MEKEPRFHGSVSQMSHITMSHIKGKDTLPELTLRKALWKKNIRYRKNYRKIPGKPDVVITKYKIAIFIDSEFFHGKDWDKRKERIKSGTNGEYWTAKIERNIERDREQTITLRNLGYTVVRFWSREVLDKTDECLESIEEIIFEKKIGAFENEAEYTERSFVRGI